MLVQPSLSRRASRKGFTLVELLVAMTVTLILIFALSQAFALVGETVARGRATIEMSGSLRAVASRLEDDLEGITVPVRPWADPASGLGYFEYLDGPSTDKDWNADGTNDTNPATSNTTFGDVDDILAFTAHSKGEPFVGQVGGNVVESLTAEIVWWIQLDDVNGNGSQDAGESYMICRRVMLVRPDLGVVFSRTAAGNNAYSNDPAGYQLLRTDLLNFFNNNDISVNLRWWISSGPNPRLNVVLRANSLSDLTRRENRFVHWRILDDVPGTGLALRAATFPYVLDLFPQSVTALPRMLKFDNNAGEDIMTRNALAFDVQAFDPGAPLRPSSNADEALVPSDPAYFPDTWPSAWSASGPNDTIGYGAFVDLGYGVRKFSAAAGWSMFSGTPQARSRLATSTIWSTPTYCYDTWCTWYERNGADEDQDNESDEGTNGFDDDSANGVDDVGERETSPPYPVPLRGIQVRIRAWDPDSRQVRQASVITDFIPE